ncbi:PREDICTED: BAG family molecular chaperone regulator 5, mitochondrial [Camelina sativa]|uniref:BAG family molecular chaperone regulator 5, mitochondrial n=1 Tax=Camelina sativa TaxID=90675 RepID=A0ABM0Y0L0_CAMSA|nr:PREDICTED: BAG family molecular chaperone regulator 5, mitochondrial [Camelina sativa]
MRSSKNFSSSTTTTTIIHTFYNDHNTPPAPSTKQIPIETPTPAAKSTAQTNSSSAAAAAARIQSGYRSHRIRNLYKTISSVNREANRVQSMIQRQDTVDAIRTDEKERLRMNEILMSLLLRLDSVPGLDPSIREARRKVSRKIVGMQEILDSISETKDEIQWWNYNDIGGVDGGQGGGAWPMYWEEAVEEEMCREKGGEEMERFCAQYLGFRCFQRFLRE